MMKGAGKLKEGREKWKVQMKNSEQQKKKLKLAEE